MSLNNDDHTLGNISEFTDMDRKPSATSMTTKDESLKLQELFAAPSKKYSFPIATDESSNTRGQNEITDNIVASVDNFAFESSGEVEDEQSMSTDKDNSTQDKYLRTIKNIEDQIT